jgi:hypothetical protein
LSRFVFIEPPPSGSIHCNQSNDSLQLQVDIFCSDVCLGVNEWDTGVATGNAAMQARLAELLVVRDPRGGLRF